MTSSRNCSFAHCGSWSIFIIIRNVAPAFSDTRRTNFTALATIRAASPTSGMAPNRFDSPRRRSRSENRLPIASRMSVTTKKPPEMFPASHATESFSHQPISSPQTAPSAKSLAYVHLLTSSV